jgi:hypothetical protein
MEENENTKSGKKAHFHWLEKFNTVKMSVLPQVICRFNVIPIKIPMVFFTELEQNLSLHETTHKKPD